jgi:antitoxin StbD
MTITAPASEVEKNFDAYHERALTGEAVRVTKQGRETVYILSAKAFHELRQSQRDALSAAELTEAELTAIENAEIPAEHRYSVHDEPEAG